MSPGGGRRVTAVVAANEAKQPADAMPVPSHQRIEWLDGQAQEGQLREYRQRSEQRNRFADAHQCRSAPRPAARRIDDVESRCQLLLGRRIRDEASRTLEREQPQAASTIEPPQEPGEAFADVAIPVVENRKHR